MLLNNLSKCVSSRIPKYSQNVFTNCSLVAPKNKAIIFSVRTCAARKMYGSEEGHHTKNEVRKEKWIRKRMRRSLGGEYREYLGLQASAMSIGEPLVDGLDWSFADGRPGVPGMRQIKQLYREKDYAYEIKAALDLVKQFEEANLAKQEEEDLVNQSKESLKPKGAKVL